MNVSHMANVYPILVLVQQVSYCNKQVKSWWLNAIKVCFLLTHSTMLMTLLADLSWKLSSRQRLRDPRVSISACRVILVLSETYTRG